MRYTIKSLIIFNSNTACYSLYLLKYESLSVRYKRKVIIDYDRTSPRYGCGLNEESQWLVV